jgi:flagellar motor switch protein FliG
MTARNDNDAVAKVIATLDMLSSDAKAAVLERMSPQARDRISERLAELGEKGGRPHSAFSGDIADKRKLIRDAAARIAAAQAKRVSNSVAAADEQDMLGAPAPDANSSTLDLLDPLSELRRVHPAALARAMQGERAEAWAIVLDRIDSNSRAALERYLDHASRVAIERAATRQSELREKSPRIVASIEQAIARTVVPLALREHQQLVSTPYGAEHGAAV